MKNLFEKILDPLALLTRNWVGGLGVVLVTTGAVLWLFFLPTMIRGDAENPYTGILTFLVLPAIFFAGLALIPAGWWLSRRKPLPPRPDALRRLAVFLGVTTFANLLIGSQFTYRAVHHMSSAEFCGEACHSVMAPEYTAYQSAPHSRVPCTGCHVGPGASWFVKSKLSGTRRVFALAFNTYARPVPAPVHDLRPARETCETCHWPRKFGTDRLRRIPKYAEDEANTRSDTLLLMRIGGGRDTAGIHGAHLGEGKTIRYRPADYARSTIPWVEVESAAGREVYLAPKTKAEETEKFETRVMDCIDCHNRPAHIFDLPGRAVDHAFDDGRLDPRMPFLKKRAVELLNGSYPNESEAGRQIREKLKAAYGSNYEKPAEVLTAIWRRNVFPEMKVTWGTYPNHIGHTDSPGCFRCHDAEHATASGKTIQQDCNSCHQLLAMDESNPKILTDLGLPTR